MLNTVFFVIKFKTGSGKSVGLLGLSCAFGVE